MKNIAQNFVLLLTSKNNLLLLVFFLMPFLQHAHASVHYNNTVVEQKLGKRYSKVKKASDKKEKKFKKRRLERFSFNFWHLVGALLISGTLLFILGLALKIKALWIVGLCLFGLPIFAGIVILLILILGLAFGNGVFE